MEFKSTSVIKYPVKVVWPTMRDELPEIVPLLNNIESITVRERTELDSEKIKITNVWRAAPKLPSFLVKKIKPEMLAWTDYAEWNQKNRECHWRIESHFFTDHFKCRGTTLFDSAIAGRGTRITFQGSLKLLPQGMDEVSHFFGARSSGVIESFLNKLIPNNIVKVAKALSDYLDGK